MTKTDKTILEEIIRVDHAGERGAIKIYEGQLLALKTFRKYLLFVKSFFCGHPAGAIMKPVITWAIVFLESLLPVL